MKTLFIFILSVISISLQAQQVTRVSLQASGLTCSMCSNSINKSLKTIPFVDKVDANIQTSTFEIIFKSGSPVDFDKLKNKVEDAGFSVSKFVATVNFNKVSVKGDQVVNLGDKNYYFVNFKEGLLNGTKAVRILNKGFVSAKEFKKNSFAAVPAGSKVYYATI